MWTNCQILSCWAVINRISENIAKSDEGYNNGHLGKDVRRSAQIPLEYLVCLYQPCTVEAEDGQIFGILEEHGVSISAQNEQHSSIYQFSGQTKVKVC